MLFPSQLTQGNVNLEPQQEHDHGIAKVLERCIEMCHEAEEPARNLQAVRRLWRTVINTYSGSLWLTRIATQLLQAMAKTKEPAKEDDRETWCQLCIELLGESGEEGVESWPVTIGTENKTPAIRRRLWRSVATACLHSSLSLTRAQLLDLLLEPLRWVPLRSNSDASVDVHFT